MYVGRRNVIEGRTLALEAGQLKGLAVVLILSIPKVAGPVRSAGLAAMARSVCGAPSRVQERERQSTAMGREGRRQDRGFLEGTGQQALIRNGFLSQGCSLEPSSSVAVRPCPAQPVYSRGVAGPATARLLRAPQDAFVVWRGS